MWFLSTDEIRTDAEDDLENLAKALTRIPINDMREHSMYELLPLFNFIEGFTRTPMEKDSEEIFKKRKDGLILEIHKRKLPKTVETFWKNVLIPNFFVKFPGKNTSVTQEILLFLIGVGEKSSLNLKEMVPDIKTILSTLADIMLSFSAQIKKLKVSGPTNLEEAYFYWKYIVQKDNIYQWFADPLTHPPSEVKQHLARSFMEQHRGELEEEIGKKNAERIINAIKLDDPFYRRSAADADFMMQPQQDLGEGGARVRAADHPDGEEHGPPQEQPRVEPAPERNLGGGIPIPVQPVINGKPEIRMIATTSSQPRVRQKEGETIVANVEIKNKPKEGGGIIIPVSLKENRGDKNSGEDKMHVEINKGDHSVPQMLIASEKNPNNGERLTESKTVLQRLGEIFMVPLDVNEKEKTRQIPRTPFESWFSNADTNQRPTSQELKELPPMVASTGQTAQVHQTGTPKGVLFYNTENGPVIVNSGQGKQPVQSSSELFLPPEQKSAQPSGFWGWLKNIGEAGKEITKKWTDLLSVRLPPDNTQYSTVSSTFERVFDEALNDKIDEQNIADAQINGIGDVTDTGPREPPTLKRISLINRAFNGEWETAEQPQYSLLRESNPVWGEAIQVNHATNLLGAQITSLKIKTNAAGSAYANLVERAKNSTGENVMDILKIQEKFLRDEETSLETSIAILQKERNSAYEKYQIVEENFITSTRLRGPGHEKENAEFRTFLGVIQRNLSRAHAQITALMKNREDLEQDLRELLEIKREEEQKQKMKNVAPKGVEVGNIVATGIPNTSQTPSSQPLFNPFKREEPKKTRVPVALTVGDDQNSKKKEEEKKKREKLIEERRKAAPPQTPSAASNLGNVPPPLPNPISKASPPLAPTVTSEIPSSKTIPNQSQAITPSPTISTSQINPTAQMVPGTEVTGEISVKPSYNTAEMLEIDKHFKKMRYEGNTGFQNIRSIWKQKRELQAMIDEMDRQDKKNKGSIDMNRYQELKQAMSKLEDIETTALDKFGTRRKFSKIIDKQSEHVSQTMAKLDSETYDFLKLNVDQNKKADLSEIIKIRENGIGMVQKSILEKYEELRSLIKEAHKIDASDVEPEQKVNLKNENEVKIRKIRGELDSKFSEIEDYYSNTLEQSNLADINLFEERNALIQTIDRFMVNYSRDLLTQKDINEARLRMVKSLEIIRDTNQIRDYWSKLNNSEFKMMQTFPIEIRNIILEEEPAAAVQATVRGEEASKEIPFDQTEEGKKLSDRLLREWTEATEEEKPKLLEKHKMIWESFKKGEKMNLTQPPQAPENPAAPPNEAPVAPQESPLIPQPAVTQNVNPIQQTYVPPQVTEYPQPAVTQNVSPIQQTYVPPQVTEYPQPPVPPIPPPIQQQIVPPQVTLYPQAPQLPAPPPIQQHFVPPAPPVIHQAAINPAPEPTQQPVLPQIQPQITEPPKSDRNEKEPREEFADYNEDEAGMDSDEEREDRDLDAFNDGIEQEEEKDLKITKPVNEEEFWTPEELQTIVEEFNNLFGMSGARVNVSYILDMIQHYKQEYAKKGWPFPSKAIYLGWYSRDPEIRKQNARSLWDIYYNAYIDSKQKPEKAKMLIDYFHQLSKEMEQNGRFVVNRNLSQPLRNFFRRFYGYPDEGEVGTSLQNGPSQNVAQVAVNQSQPALPEVRTPTPMPPPRAPGQDVQMKKNMQEPLEKVEKRRSRTEVETEEEKEEETEEKREKKVKRSEHTPPVQQQISQPIIPSVQVGGTEYDKSVQDIAKMGVNEMYGERGVWLEEHPKSKKEVEELLQKYMYSSAFRNFLQMLPLNPQLTESQRLDAIFKSSSYTEIKDAIEGGFIYNILSYSAALKLKRKEADNLFNYIAKYPTQNGLLTELIDARLVSRDEEKFLEAFAKWRSEHKGKDKPQIPILWRTKKKKN